MKPPSPISVDVDPSSRRSRICSYLPSASLLFLVILLGSALILSDYNQKSSFWKFTHSAPSLLEHKCKNQIRPPGSETLPKGIVSKTSNLEMRPLWTSSNSTKPKSKLDKKIAKSSISLFAMVVGIKQKDLVNKMIKKFLSNGFVVMLCHYDGIVDEWKEFPWSDLVVHVSAVNQTKWWFAKRFLHPDIVADYSYIFLWDEDLGVDNFNPQRYLSIVRTEGLEISQPALDFAKSEVHHQITARVKRSMVHRRMYKPSSTGNGCNENSTAPPCTGWIEVMAPVFSRAAWRCVWYMIQNELIHAWGLDMQLGYCAQGDRTKNIGVVDAEYLIHYGRPTLGGSYENEESRKSSSPKDHRVDVRRESYNEMKVFRRKWEEAAMKDECWTDLYPSDNTQRHATEP